MDLRAPDRKCRYVRIMLFYQPIQMNVDEF